LFAFLRTPIASTQITDPQEIQSAFSHLRPRILFWTTVGYGMFYFIRLNIPMAIPLMLDQLHISKTSMGLILTVSGVVYGISKFANGVLADRANARVFMAMALFISALLNIGFGLSSGLIALGTFWMINGYFQGMGYPPCARLLTHWFSPRELATKMSYWNASHQLGGGAITLLCGFILWRWGNWRLCFFIPAAIAMATSIALLLWLRDTPESVGLPEIEGTHDANLASSATLESTAEFKKFLVQRVFSNQYIWLVSIANFFVYAIRLSFFHWGPTFLKETRGVDLAGAGWMVAGFEFAGLAGVLVMSGLTDRICKGRGAPLCLLSMLLCGGTIFLFWRIPSHSLYWNGALMMSTGFFIYGPQALVAVIVANLATKRAAATAVGLTGIFGYASTLLADAGVGWLAQHHGWNLVFLALIGVALIGAALFAAALPAKAHGYSSEPQGGFPVIPLSVPLVEPIEAS